MRSLVATRTAAAVAATLMLAACGGTPTASPSDGDSGNGREESDLAIAAAETYDKYNEMSGQERTDELVACAEEEGQLNVYTSNTDMEDLIDVFSDQYDIEVNNYRAGSESVLQRILQEDEASYYGADIFETNALELGVAANEGLLYPYKGELRDSVLEQGRQSEFWTATRFNAFVVGWNTDNVKAGEEPKTLEELAEPQWKGRVSMEVGDVDWFTALHDYYVEEQSWSEDEFTDLMTRLASNAQVVKGHTVQGELLSAGQFNVVASNYSYITETLKRSGAPVEFEPMVEPVIARPNGLGLMKTAEHPAAAMLFADWLLTDGQKVMADLGLTPAVESMDPFQNREVIPVDTDKLLKQGDEWSKQYEEVVQKGDEVESD
jgi:iron(III) transport system substrate-binding protein